MIPNIPPKLFSGSAALVGFLLIDDTTAEEQNALSNWLMLVAQVLATNAFYKALLRSRGNSEETGRNNANTVPINEQGNNNGYRRGSQNTRRGTGNYYSNTSTNDTEETLIMLQKMVKAMQTEIDRLKNDL